MNVFWIVIALLMVAAVVALLYPVVRARSESPRYLVYLVTALGVPGLALTVYLSIGHWKIPVAPESAQQQELSAVVAQLSDRLQRQGGTLNEWMMLGKSFTVMNRFGDAANAYQQARALAGDENLDIMAFYAEARVLDDQDQLRGEAGQMFEKILAARPEDPRGLWYGGLAAYENSQFGLAVSRWERLLQQEPPDSLRPILVERISDAQRLLVEPGLTPEEKPQAPKPAGLPRTEPAAAVTAKPEAGAPSVIRVSVSADPALIGSVPVNAPVFVLARSLSPGPPLAAKRMRVADLPFTLDLSDQDAMMAGRNISSSSRVEIVARISLGGSPAAQPGDLFGSEELEVGDKLQPVEITINKRVE